MSVSIKKVESKRDLNTFIKFYISLYTDNSNIAFPLDFDERSTLTVGKNPAHKICESAYWLAYKGDKVVGRIGAIINSNELKNSDSKIGRFGFFDFIDDFDVSQALMQTATNWLKEKNMAQVHGPFGFTDLDRQGMLVKGFDRLSTMATLYNYEYYPKHIEKFGFEKSVDWVEYTFKINPEVPEKIQKISKYVQRKYGLRPLEIKTKKELKQYIPDLFSLINDTYKDLYGYTTLNKEQIEYYGKNYFGFVKKELISIIVDKDDAIVGIGVTLPSFTKALQKAKGKLFPFGWYHLLKSLKSNDILDLYLVAVKEGYRDKGVSVVMIDTLYREARDFGIKHIETNIELEDNVQVQSLWKYFDAELHKRRRCYIKNI
ncbi:GTP cyclohydrolase [uncultured Algibacter sp.]|uniref:GTP cyclohydrolase n=1 Tax=uncultured Algibacter sp. TaxID=298659 RepID=UPI002605AA09|nr:GTP cyclohydrolase [uncultured Algibacter sp.]